MSYNLNCSQECFPPYTGDMMFVQKNGSQLVGKTVCVCATRQLQLTEETVPAG